MFNNDDLDKLMKEQDKVESKLPKEKVDQVIIAAQKLSELVVSAERPLLDLLITTKLIDKQLSKDLTSAIILSLLQLSCDSTDEGLAMLEFCREHLIATDKVLTKG